MTVDTILNDERAVLALLAALAAVALWARGLRPGQHHVQEFRRSVLPLLDPIGRVVGRSLTRDKTDRQEEFVGSVDVDLLTLEQALWDDGWSQNPLSTLKWRVVDDGRQLEVATWRWTQTPRSEWMHHVYVFPSVSDDAQFDIYAHKEINYLHSPREHIHGPQQAGDVDGRVSEALGEADIELLE